ncbi:MAG: 23S rRNA (adenine(2503)-C(2))-methyltransferase RlmN [bacterium]
MTSGSLDTRRAPDVLGMTPAELARLAPLDGEPRYRAAALFRWLHKRGAASFEEMSDLPEPLRARLRDASAIPLVDPVRDATSADGSVKSILRLHDGAVVESVLMRDREKRTLCISTQVGCAVGCVFCATGAIGLARHLSPGEILRQVYVAESRLNAAEPGRRLTNVVLMGMGEPLHNFDAVQRALANLVSRSGRGMSPRRITLSTSGYPERIAQLASDGPHVRLAISLTAANDALRTRLIPLNKKYPLAALLEAGRLYEKSTRSRVTFEYVLLAGVNDSAEDARQLGRLLRGRRVNLIPLNAHAFSEMRPPELDVVDRFHAALKSAGVTSTVRWSKGGEIQAACGQLAAQA